MGNVDVKNLVLSGKGIVTGKGAISFLETLNYKRVIIVTGGNSMIRNGIIDKTRKMLEKTGSRTERITRIQRNPSFDEVADGLL